MVHAEGKQSLVYKAEMDIHITSLSVVCDQNYDMTLVKILNEWNLNLDAPQNYLNELRIRLNQLHITTRMVMGDQVMIGIWLGRHRRVHTNRFINKVYKYVYSSYIVVAQPAIAINPFL